MAYTPIMGMKLDSTSLDGVWAGRFWLKDRNREGVPFSVWFTIKDGRLNGSTLEPNKFALITDEQLDATIRGHVADDEIAFLKSYRAFEHEPVYFEGELSEDRRRVEGQWYFGWPHEWTGPFEMTRSTKDQVATDAQEPAAKTHF
ncbi:MAG: hypothetical protein ACX94B_05180 [Henriciella sp.]